LAVTFAERLKLGRFILLQILIAAQCASYNVDKKRAAVAEIADRTTLLLGAVPEISV